MSEQTNPLYGRDRILGGETACRVGFDGRSYRLTRRAGGEWQSLDMPLRRTYRKLRDAVVALKSAIAKGTK